MKKISIPGIEAKVKHEMEALKPKLESEIHTSETRVLQPEIWAAATVGKFYPAIKRPIRAAARCRID